MSSESKATMEDKSDKFGINMKQFCRGHEAWVNSQTPSQAVIDVHLEKLRWLQHERLVHLIVTVMVVFVELFVVGLVLIHPEIGLGATLIMFVLAILLGFYFYHYFFLENTVQHWYIIAERLRHAVRMQNPRQDAPLT